MKTQKTATWMWIAIGLVLGIVCLGSESFAQQANDGVCISNVTTPTGMRGWFRPRADLRVTWFETKDDLRQDNLTFHKYVVECSTDSTFQGQIWAETVRGENFHIFREMKAKETYYFKITARDENNELIAFSGVFQYRIPTDTRIKITPAFLSLMFLERIGVLDGATNAYNNSSWVGCFAFEAIAIFFYIGFIVWLRRTAPRLRATNVFLVDEKIDNINECDKIVDIAKENNLQEHQIDALMRLTKGRLTRKYFYGHGLMSRLSRISFGEWAVKRRQRKKEYFKDLPAVKIIDTACLNTNKGATELEKSLENRIVAEDEELKKRSVIDILWGIGVTAPLLGLFGTVTGISSSFKIIGETSAQDKFMMSELAGGIFEALFTTICGLIVGILFMSAFYYYNYKLDRVHTIWVTFVTEYVDLIKRVNSSAGSSSGSPKGSKDDKTAGELVHSSDGDEAK